MLKIVEDGAADVDRRFVAARSVRHDGGCYAGGPSDETARQKLRCSRPMSRIRGIARCPL